MDPRRILTTLILPVAVVNAVGTAFGFVYYMGMFVSFPPYLWPFIPDSPLSTLLFSLALFLIYAGRGPQWLNLAAGVAVMKYGLWTDFVILFYSDHFLSPDLRSFYYLMFFLHLGMLFEPIILLPHLRPRARHLALVLTWYLLNDYTDYWIGTNPLAPYHFQGMGVVAIFSVLSTFGLSLGLYGAARVYKRRSAGTK